MGVTFLNIFLKIKGVNSASRRGRMANSEKLLKKHWFFPSKFPVKFEMEITEVF